MAIFTREDSTTARPRQPRRADLPERGRPGHAYYLGLPGLRDPCPLLHRQGKHPSIGENRFRHTNPSSVTPHSHARFTCVLPTHRSCGVRNRACPVLRPRPCRPSSPLAVSMTPRSCESLSQSPVLSDVQLPTCQPQIQVVDVIQFTSVPLNTNGHLSRAKQPAHSPQHQTQESHPEERHQNPSTHTQLPAPRTSEHQGHPFQVSSPTTYEDSAPHMTIRQAEP